MACAFELTKLNVFFFLGVFCFRCPAVGEPTIAGAISSGTHATGKHYGNLGSYVSNTMKSYVARI